MNYRLLIALVCILGLFACSSNSKKKQEKALPLVDFEASAKLVQNWSTSVGKGRDKRYSNLAPALANQRIYVADVTGLVRALSQDSGKRIWKTKLKHDLSSGVGADDKHVFVGTFAGKLIALDANTGEQKWLASVSSEILAIPASNGEVVVAQTIDGRAFAFDTQSGKQLWRYDHTLPALTLRGSANPIITRSQLILAFGNGQLISLNIEDGALRWSARLSQPKGRTELDKIVDVDSTPLISAGLLFASNYQGAIGAYSVAQGQQKWRRDFSSYRDTAAASGKLFGVSDRSEVVAFERANGAETWVNDQMLYRNLSHPVAIGSYLAVVDKKAYLHVLDQSDGRFVARKKLANKGYSAPIKVIGDSILLLSDDGKLSSYSIKPKAKRAR